MDALRQVALVVFHNPPSIILREVPYGWPAQETADFIEYGISSMPDEIILLENGQHKPKVTVRWSIKAGDYYKTTKRKKYERHKKVLQNA